MNPRLRLIQLSFVAWVIIILVRLVYWQAVKGPFLRQQASLQHSYQNPLPAQRGEILASDGQPLVANIDHYQLQVQLEQLPADLNSLWSLLPSSDSAKERISLARQLNLSWLTLAKDLPATVKSQISQLSISGLFLTPDSGRYYPEGSSSAYITGFLGRDSQGEPRGYFGLEGYYDRHLAGKLGRLFQELDALGSPIVIGERRLIPPHNGQVIHTSIDRTIQFLAYKKLSEGLINYQAEGGSVSVMEPNTGQVLALVALPSYDPRQFSQASPSAYPNPIISTGYEPGSTFKTLVMAASLDAKVVSPDTICLACTGPVNIGGQTIRNWNDKYFPHSTMTDVVLHSDNVGMVYVAKKLGKSRLLSYLRRFGIGSPTGIDLQEESSPVLRPDEQWYDIDWATVAFGQGIAVTPIQMLTAVNALANGGRLVPPRLVTHIGSKKLAPSPGREVVSPSAASQITAMMVNGTTKGEVRYYKPPGYKIAGKTGTAQVPISGHYDPNRVIASFVGFAPADNPRFTMLVTLNNPQTSPWGSTTAAPLWFNIARDIFRYYAIPPS